MSKSVELVPVSKGADYLEVHPDTLTAHKALGWQQCQRREPPADDGKQSGGLKVEELKTALAAKGIEIPDGAKKSDLQALLDKAG